VQRVAKRLWAATAGERWAALSKIQAMAGFAAFHARIAHLVSGRLLMLYAALEPRGQVSG
jgi:hypothetical protein